jgi:aldehyde dehydrogenase (NAD+)
MISPDRHFIAGQWQGSQGQGRIAAIDPSTETQIALVARGNADDIDAAVSSARRSFETFSNTSKAERAALLEAIATGFESRREDLCAAIISEMGVPVAAARDIHFASGPAHFRATAEALRAFAYDEPSGTTMVTHEPIGVCGLITPWNFPVNQLACKLAPALGSGCTVVLKPSECSALSANVVAEILHEAGVPDGVFNLVHGDGAMTGAALCAHPGVDMISFTGSTRAGVEIARAAAPSVKRVTLELGGKSPNILLDDVDLEEAVMKGAARCFNNSGQSCIAPSRMLIPRSMLTEAERIAARTAHDTPAGSAYDPKSRIGPLANAAQYEKVRGYIDIGLKEGARLVAGGRERPNGVEQGYVVPATVFSGVSPGMRIAREEIFGPVLCLIPYEDEADAIKIANDTPYGLAAFVQGRDMGRVRRVARHIRAGIVQVNYPPVDRGAPFGGYKQSGNGREWGAHGLREYFEIKSIIGYGA